jgi:hypothetical protein
MSDSNSVLARVPPKIWRRIHLKVMHVPYLLHGELVRALEHHRTGVDQNGKGNYCVLEAELGSASQRLKLIGP